MKKELQSRIDREKDPDIKEEIRKGNLVTIIGDYFDYWSRSLL